MSLCIVVAAVGFLGFEALTKTPAPPRISIRVDSIVPLGERFLVEVRVENSGQSTAAGLLIEGELTDGDTTIERSEATIGYVPGESTRSAGLFFSHDPRGYELRLRPKGYDRP